MNPAPANTSSLYQGAVWRLGLGVARALPRGLAWRCGWWLGAVYGAAKPARRQIVVNNLLPVFASDAAQAGQTARLMFREFGAKLADLWQLEAGRTPEAQFASLNGLEHARAARAAGRGVLLVSFHLGNWELGAPLVAAKQLPLTIITQAEPHADLTEIRRRMRARWDVHTVVIGEGGFEFVEIIKRLQDGEAAAMLIDRPLPGAGQPLELFGRPFPAAISPADLARATGCAVLPTYIVREPAGYVARILPEIPYDRAALGDRAARHAFMQAILRGFEPLVRRHPAQWFHFTPLWP